MAFGNTEEPAHEVVLGWAERGQAADGPFDRRTGEDRAARRADGRAPPDAAGTCHVRQKLGDYDRAVGAGVTVVPLLVETFGGCAPPLMSALQRAADWRQNKLTSSEYDETTWSARTAVVRVAAALRGDAAGGGAGGGGGARPVGGGRPPPAVS